MANKLTGNGMWEASRMMLPEHKVRINQLAEEQKKRVRIYLDEQDWEDISRIVAQSLERKEPIKLKMFHELEELEVNGIVDRVDQLQGRFMVDGEWFKIRDIEGAQLDD
ncbi:YolD-like family protein [Paenibacillus sp. NRS-1760]|uniref:YolD-like family protein n=1 Tax=Paenibacillus sp. NRS-1760 TaxID=3233902 RepID=UPI003D2B465C